ncbi:MAG: GNAT family N-acetyltransferase [Bacteroidetes bacterium]|nr:MAG: GNAT family N-acetyltransferase [Bacteroidota bacterium]
MERDNKEQKYLFRSTRLGFRDWREEDIPKMVAINADPIAMEFFPSLVGASETADFIARMRYQLEQKRHCYFAVDELETGAFIGFIGLSEQTYKADFTPCVDIGWRLSPQFWNRGYATEGALRCLEYAFNDLNLLSVYATCPVINEKSENVMKKAGMHRVKNFMHSRMLGNERLQECVLYHIHNPAIR